MAQRSSHTEEEEEEQVQEQEDGDIQMEDGNETIRDEREQQQSSQRSRIFDPNVTPSESSFAPDGAAVSSTPMVRSSSRGRTGSRESPSWSKTLQSPLERLDRGLESLVDEEDSLMDSSQQTAEPQSSIDSSDRPTPRPVFTAQEKGKGKNPPSTLLQNVLNKNLREGTGKHTSPLKIRKTPKKKNPYIEPDSQKDWDGIVDLTKPMTPRPAARKQQANDWSSDEEGIPAHMSPPASAFGKRVAKIGRTPKREAAARIGQDLVGIAQKGKLRERFNLETDSSIAESVTSPTLGHYTRQAMGIISESEGVETETSQSKEQSRTRSTVSPPAGIFGQVFRRDPSAEPSIGGMIRQMGQNQSSREARPSQSYQEERTPVFRPPNNQLFDDSFDDDGPNPVFANLNALPDSGDVGHDDSDSFEDSFEDNPGVPSEAFIMASRNQLRDDSFDGTDSSDSLDDDVGEGAPIHPFANFGVQGNDSFDDSFDDSFGDNVGGGGGGEEPTVFGLQPAQRGGGLHLHGQFLVDDTEALDMHLGPRSVPDTPTPGI